MTNPIVWYWTTAPDLYWWAPTPTGPGTGPYDSFDALRAAIARRHGSTNTIDFRPRTATVARLRTTARN